MKKLSMLQELQKVKTSVESSEKETKYAIYESSISGEDVNIAIPLHNTEQFETFINNEEDVESAMKKCEGFIVK